GSIDMNEFRRMSLLYRMESIGVITVSLSPSQVNIVIGVGVSKSFLISASDLPACFSSRYRSDRFIPVSSNFALSPRNGSRLFHCLSNEACTVVIHSFWAASAYVCILELMVV